MPATLIAIDQGTTSTRAIVFDAELRPLATAQQELHQIYPAPGEVEHDPEEIWSAVVTGVRAAMTQARIGAKDVAGIGITNQRETVVIWDRQSSQPIHNAIVWQDRRTADYCEALRRDGHEPDIVRKTGLLIDPYFSASKIAWLLDRIEGARSAAEVGKLAFGTIDTFLLWRLTGGRAHLTDATNAARTLLFDIGQGTWDTDLCRLFKVPHRVASGGARLRGHLWRNGRRPVRRPDPHPWDCRRPAGGHDRAGVFRAGHGQIDLWHRLFCAAQYRA